MESNINVLKKDLSKNSVELKTIFKNLQSLIDNSIFDFSILRELITQIEQNQLKNSPEAFIKYYAQILKEKLKIYETNNSLENYITLTNYTLLFMIILINLKSNIKFLYQIFDKNSKLIEVLISILKTENNCKKKSKKISKILCNIFLDEYKLIFFNSEYTLDEIFIYNNEKFSQVNNEGLDVYPKSLYKNILENLLNSEYSYDLLFQDDKRGMESILSDQTILKDLKKISKGKSDYSTNEIPFVKSQFIQSLIRISLSNEKDNYYTYTGNLEGTLAIKSFNYSVQFIYNIVEKCLVYTRNNFGDNHSCLFRKEEMYTDIIKSYLTMYGNNIIIKSFVQPLNSFLSAEKKDKDFLNSINFIALFENVIEVLESQTPKVLKILFKVLFDKVKEIFTVDANTNFYPILTLLFFNFLISPRIQEIYGISPVKYEQVRVLNRIIRNICFNVMFNEYDELKVYNEIIEDCHGRLKILLANMISSVRNEDLYKKKDFNIYEDLVYCPKFLFYFDCALVTRIFKNGLGENFNIYEVIKKDKLFNQY